MPLEVSEDPDHGDDAECEDSEGQAKDEAISPALVVRRPPSEFDRPVAGGLKLHVRVVRLLRGGE